MADDCVCIAPLTKFKEDRYSKYCGEDLILRDELAIDRTVLANERTLLSYLRSAVPLVIAGITIVNFSDKGWFRAMGIACIPTGIITAVIGVARYRIMNRSIMHIRGQSETGKQQRP
jgi:putative membrane protein